ncbi:MAG TPA: hypothetical protein VHA10_02780 [Hypericibacter adhaerens]|jgi:hypothetical protein|uniref:Uncharacterized protein n=1 Tax=Hypericibacter adhaerens TaxID=2602016 RepID=A0A5J6N2C8_9PROT|nr:hypothetical protein [Hypericibacter adhaerens]QEX22740.1 hypothetical protein FRZ61_26720 [Hypericibacter adhaerens]HWA42106.1 hypothetical protein [Hypericibacter adhaerens]
MKSTFGLILMALAVLSGLAALIGFLFALVFSDIRTLGAGGSGGLSDDALILIAGFAVASLLLWWGGRSLRRATKS